MARPTRCRRVCAIPGVSCFGPRECPDGETVCLTVDEYEAVRLIDYEKQTHEQCARQMGISRTTVTEIYKKARFKLSDCIVNGKNLQITGGHYRLCDGSGRPCRQTHCRKAGQMASPSISHAEGVEKMKIAVTYEQGMVFQHFGHTRQFKLYEVENGRIAHAEIIDTMGSGHGALAGFLSAHRVDTLICGGIGAGAQTALANAGIRLYGGVSGSADDAVTALLNGSLSFNPNIRCDHHGHGHTEEGHSCGEHKQGCPGNSSPCRG